MADLRDLYQEVIFDHNKRPRNFRRLETANRTAEGYNPLCGDQLALYLLVEHGVVKDATFQGTGCAISIASASLMTEILKGKTEQEAEALFQGFHTLVTTPSGTPVEAGGLGKLQVLVGVREYPSRVKCATLAWHTLHAALASQGQAVSTE
jgi:nitrogen fixation protein NifU and related proteins